MAKVKGAVVENDKALILTYLCFKVDNWLIMVVSDQCTLSSADFNDSNTHAPSNTQVKNGSLCCR